MRIVFRADASIQIGTGHVMRCLTLAEELTRQGHECQFICRAHEGNLGELIGARGFSVHLLATSDEDARNCELDWNAHAQWLGVPWQLDAQQTLNILNQQQVDWLVVDHYALDAAWEQLVAEKADCIMVIDDLADRNHDCDLLLDQTLGRTDTDYAQYVPARCHCLCGAGYALLRPEFAEWRVASHEYRQLGGLRHLLINLGGVDKDDVTSRILEALRDAALPEQCSITVVMGRTAPWIKTVKKQAEHMPWPTRVKVGVNNMAKLMASSDLAIGAAGATSWERCCLGVPTVMVVLAGNQEIIAANLGTSGAAVTLDTGSLAIELARVFSNMDNATLKAMSQKAAEICDGFGAERVVERLVLGQ